MTRIYIVNLTIDLEANFAGRNENSIVFGWIFEVHEGFLFVQFMILIVIFQINFIKIVFLNRTFTEALKN